MIINHTWKDFDFAVAISNNISENYGINFILEINERGIHISSSNLDKDTQTFHLNEEDISNCIIDYMYSVLSNHIRNKISDQILTQKDAKTLNSASTMPSQYKSLTK